MARLADIVIDCRHPAALARFWAAALDDYDIADYTDDEIARLAELGITYLDDDPTVLVEASTGPRLWFQRVPELKATKNRVHLDIRSGDRGTEVERLVGLGATMIAEVDGKRLTVLVDPEGNEFCVID